MPKALFLLFPLFALSAHAQLTCSARQYPPTTVRVEGYTELLGDMVVACTGGIPTAAGAAIPFLDITLSLSIPITNRKSPSESFIDALLLIDEPHSVANPNVPLLPCISCAAPIGNGIGRGVYNGATGYPNVFQGELTGNSTVRFRVPFDPPGNGVERIVRVANLRVNGTRMAGVVPNTVVGTLNIPGAAMSPSTQILGLAHRGLRIATAANKLSTLSATQGPAELFACPRGLGIAPIRDRDQPNFQLVLEEQTRDGLRARNAGQDQPSGPAGAFGSLFRPDVNQNVIGYPYGTETGTFSGAPGNPARPVPQITTSTPFEPNRGLNRAGLATHGTRFYIRFTNSGNLAISLPVSIVFDPLLFTTLGPRNQAAPTRAILIQGDSTSSPANFTPVIGNAKGFARIPSNGSTTTAVYEVVSADTSTLEGANIPIFVDQPSPAGDQGKVTISVGLGPSSDVTGPDASAPIPRFAADNGDSVDGFVHGAAACSSVQDVSVTVTASGTRGGIGLMNIQYWNLSTAPMPGLATVQAVLPPGLAPTRITGDSDMTCTLQTLRCSLSGDRRGPGVVQVLFDIPANAPPSFSVSASVTATGDERPSNNTASAEVLIAAAMNFEVVDSVAGSRDVMLIVDGVHSTYRARAFATGATVTVSTIANQYSYEGALRIFKAWDNGGPMAQSFTNPNARPSLLSFEAVQPTVQCFVNAGVPPLLPATAKTAALSDVTLNCTGGTPTPTGSPVPRVDIRVSVGSVLTSRNVFPGVSEALLIVDEPHSDSNPNVPLLPCGANGSGNNPSGICFNAGAGSLTYSGTTGRPNVFQGVFDGVDSVLFQQVPLDPPGANFTRIFRFTNLRADVSLLPASSTPIPTMIFESVQLSPAGNWTLLGNGTVVAFMESPVQQSNPTVALLPQCLAANAQIAADPSKPLGTGAGNGAQVTLVLTEQFTQVFQAKNLGVALANRAPGASYPPDTKQNVPGAIFNSQTMFYAGPGSEPDLRQLFFASQNIPPTADFPAFRGLNLAGKADSGTRVAVRFTAIPTGVKLFLPVRITLNNTLSGGAAGVAHLTATDAAGAGAFSRIDGNAAGIAPLTVTPSGEATAFYEILNADAFAQERLTIPVVLAYAAGQPALGTIQATVGLAPFVTATGNATDLSGFIPRYSAQFPDPRPIATIQTCAVPDLQLTMTRSGPRTTAAGTTYRLNVTNVGTVGSPGPQRLSVTASPIVSLSGTGWSCSIQDRECTRNDSLLPAASYPTVTIEVGPAPTGSNAAGMSASIASIGSNELSVSNNFVQDFSPVIQGGQTFVPLSQPCRLVDTRDTFGGTPLRLQTQTFSLTGKCQLPAADSPSAPTAYSLNVTVVPKTTLGYLSIWPAGQEQPLVSTLNSLDGRVKANAAIIPAGVNGAVSVFVTDDTEVILDLTGYFANSGGLDFVPVTPCRVVDTRNPNGPYGGPIFEPVTSRDFTIAESNCVSGLPNVYSLNATVVPSGPLGYLTLSNPNILRPTVSTLNAVTGAITANAALIAGSTSFGAGRLAAFVTERTHLLLDINGTFQSGGGLKYYPIQPCRLVDTRNPTGPYGGPALARTTERVFDVPAGGCGIPANARAYAVNATVVPTGPFGFLTLWGAGSARPTVSTLNALDGAITSNAAIVSDSGSTAQRGRISVYASDAVHLILDVNGYFAP